MNVTPIGEPRLLGVSRVISNEFEVYGTPGDFFWVVYGTRDLINVEPDKDKVLVGGNGPYRYIR